MKMAAILLASITGLWAGRRDFGPDVRGPLQIESDGRHYVAEIAGRTAEVTIEHDKVAFALPNQEGSFRGALRGDRIVGH